MSTPEYSTTFAIGDVSFTLNLAAPDEAPVPVLLIPFMTWLREQGMLAYLQDVVEEVLVRHMRRRVHTPFDKLMTDVVALATGTSTNLEVSTLLRPCAPLAQAMEQIQGLPDHSGMSRFHACFSDRAPEALRLCGQQVLARQSVLRTGAGPVVIDLDGTGYLTTTEGARRGYFGPRAQGKTGLQWHQATAHPLDAPSHVRERLVAFLDPGNVPTKCRFYDLFWDVLDVLDQIGLVEGLDDDGRPVVRRPLLWRYDGGITCGEYVEFLLEMQQHFISRGHDGRTAPRILREIGSCAWHWVSPNQEAAEAGYRKVRNCRYAVRVILLRNHQPHGGIKYSHLVTSLPVEAVPLATVLALAPETPETPTPPPAIADHPGQESGAVVILQTGVDTYNQRQTIEAAIKEDKRVLHRDHQRSHSFVANEALAQLGLLVANLLLWFKQDLLADTPLEGMGVARFLHEALLLPARLLTHPPRSPDPRAISDSEGRTHFELRLLLPSLPAIRLIRALAGRGARATPAPTLAC